MSLFVVLPQIRKLRFQLPLLVGLLLHPEFMTTAIVLLIGKVALVFVPLGLRIRRVKILMAVVAMVLVVSSRSFIVLIVRMLCCLETMLVVLVVDWLIVVVNSFWLHLEHEITSLY